MKWKEVLIGAVITLVVSVIAGVVVWFVTTYQVSPSQSEDLKYQVQNIATFDVGANKLGFVLVKLTNQGGRAARDVKFVVTFADPVDIREKELTISTGNAGKFEEVKTGHSNSLNIIVPNLAPKEKLSASLLVGGTKANFTPDVIVRSSETVGVAANLDGSGEKPAPALITLIVVVAVMLQGIALLWLGRRFMPWKSARLAPSLEYERNRNNTAFMYTHRKLLPEATKLLDKEIEAEGASAFELSNLGLLRGLAGNRLDAENYFGIAQWFTTDKRSNAVLAFNRGALAIASKDYSQAKDELIKAFSLDPVSVLEYCKLSKFVEDGIVESDSLRELLTEKGVAPV